MLKDARNMFNAKFIIREVLTLHRRLLQEKTESELTSYKYGWVKNGCVYVRKDDSSPVIHVSNEFVLNELIRNQNGGNSDRVGNVVGTDVPAPSLSEFPRLPSYPFRPLNVFLPSLNVISRPKNGGGAVTR